MSEALYRIYMYRICIISTVGLPFGRAGGAERGRFLASVCFYSRRQVHPKTKMWNLRGFRMDLPKCGRRCHEVPKPPRMLCCSATFLEVWHLPLGISWHCPHPHELIIKIAGVGGGFWRFHDLMGFWYDYWNYMKLLRFVNAHNISITSWYRGWKKTVFNWRRISQPSTVSHLNFEPCLNHPCWEGQAQMCHRHSVAGEVCDGAEEPLPGRLGNEGMEIQEVKILWMEEILN